jgi:hypothetical protein
MDDQKTDRDGGDLMYGLLTEAIIHFIKIQTEPAVKLASDLERLRNGIDHSSLRSQAIELVWLIFAPTMDWDDIARETDIANRVIALADEMRKRETT